MDIFEATCKCGTTIEVRVPSSLSMGGVKCPSCQRTIPYKTEGTPRPQRDTSASPAPQAQSRKY